MKIGGPHAHPPVRDAGRRLRLQARRRRHGARRGEIAKVIQRNKKSQR